MDVYVTPNLQRIINSMCTFFNFRNVIIGDVYIVTIIQVNSVSWNETGTKLISGSDDCHINIYDMATDLVSPQYL